MPHLQCKCVFRVAQLDSGTSEGRMRVRSRCTRAVERSASSAWGVAVENGVPNVGLCLDPNHSGILGEREESEAGRV